MHNGERSKATCSEAFLPFVNLLSETVQFDDFTSDTPSRIKALLDGAAGQAVITHVPKNIRSQDGIFFSGHHLADQAIKPLISPLSNGSSIFDPACGAGDLLIAAAWHMPLSSSLEKTLSIWGAQIGGCDIHEGFVEAAKWRLLMLAMLRHKQLGDEIAPQTLNPSIFPKIVVGSFFDIDESACYDCVITNPPFGRAVPAEKYAWAAGHVQLAGIFIDRILKQARTGQKVVAILPDVLRSGTRYGKWRCFISQETKIKKIESYGRFDRNTDVDVFILELEKITPNNTQLIHQSWTKKRKGKKMPLLSESFDVCIGPVVPHRDPGLGAWHPYIEVKHALPYSEISTETLPDNRRFKGRVFTPPFIVIRRTSNPSDKNRIIPTLVTGKKPAAVENHLLVIIPKNGLIKSCRTLKSYLTTENARVWLDSQIRCRHITTKSILSMPIEERFL